MIRNARLRLGRNSSSSEPRGPSEIRGHGSGETEPSGTELSRDSLTEYTENSSLICSTVNPEGIAGAEGEGSEVPFLVRSDDMTAKADVQHLPDKPRFKAGWVKQYYPGVACFSPAVLLVREPETAPLDF